MRALPLILALVGWLVLVPADPDRPLPRNQQEAAVDYNRDVLPILAHACFNCHGPSARKAGLRLDVRAHATQRTRSGTLPIVPGQAALSEVVRRIFAADDAERMPPPQSKTTLTAAQKQLLKKWIEQGAEYKGHWAFTRPVRPEVPKVKNRAWVQNEIDAFILERLEKAGLAPSARADKATLIRRLSLDLRGLPPSFEEVDTFL